MTSHQGDSSRFQPSLNAIPGSFSKEDSRRCFSATACDAGFLLTVNGELTASSK